MFFGLRSVSAPGRTVRNSRTTDGSGSVSYESNNNNNNNNDNNDTAADGNHSIASISDNNRVNNRDSMDGSPISSSSSHGGDSTAVGEPRKEELHIVVKCVGKGDSDSVSFHMNPTASVLELKEQICRSTGVSVERQRLVFFGKMLKDNKQILTDNGVKMKTGSTNYIHLSPLPDSSVRAAAQIPTVAAANASRSSASSIRRPTSRLTSVRRRQRRAQPYPRSSSAARQAQGSDVRRDIDQQGRTASSLNPHVQEAEVVPLDAPSAGNTGATAPLPQQHSAGHPLLQIHGGIPMLPLPASLFSSPAEAANQVSRENQILVAALCTTFLPLVSSLERQLRDHIYSSMIQSVGDNSTQRLEDTVEMLEDISEDAGHLAARFREVLEGDNDDPVARAQAARAATEAATEAAAEALASVIGLSSNLAQPGMVSTAALSLGGLGGLEFLSPPPPLPVFAQASPSIHPASGLFGGLQPPPPPQFYGGPFTGLSAAIAAASNAAPPLVPYPQPPGAPPNMAHPPHGFFPPAF